MTLKDVVEECIDEGWVLEECEVDEEDEDNEEEVGYSGVY